MKNNLFNGDVAKAINDLRVDVMRSHKYFKRIMKNENASRILTECNAMSKLCFLALLGKYNRTEKSNIVSEIIAITYLIESDIKGMAKSNMLHGLPEKRFMKYVSKVRKESRQWKTAIDKT